MTVKELIARSKAAQAEFAFATQEQADAAAKAICKVVYDNAEKLGPMAAEESRMGSEQDKIAKCRNKSALIWESLKGKKSCDIINRIEERRMIEVAKPVGVVASIIPSTNPVVTPMSNGAFALKCRNSVIFAPHPRAVKCTKLLVEMFRAELKKLGLPEDLVLGLEEVSNDLTSELMSAADMVVATGGMGMVKAAYSSGKPAIGVGAGNGPAYIHRSADVAHALACIARSKSFDYGTVCASEQSIIVEKGMESAVRSEGEWQGFYFMDTTQAGALAKLLFRPSGALNPDIVGRPAAKLAEAAGFSVPSGTKVLVAREQEAGPTRPYSMEKLCPVLAFFVMDSEDAVLSKCMEVLRHEGSGHTFAIHATDETVIRRFASKIPVSRFLVNTPAALGGIGATTGLFPALTLGCGAVGGSSSSNNISPLDLINIRRVAWDLGESPMVPQGGAAAGAVNAELVELLTEKILQRLGE